ncbi:MAG TPA: GFA family protein [Solirubrobacteraceae bacterium]|nr:GFA family protein [Solirubrobacteraceae bacterium]
MSTDVSYPIQGGCLCGRVRFEISERPAEAGYCHCTRCQHRTGTASSASAWVRTDSFRFLSGAELVKGWRHPDGGAEKRFCSNCGAHLFAQNPDTPGEMSIRMAAFDRAPDVPMSYRQFVTNAASWEPIPDDGLPRFPESRRAR